MVYVSVEINKSTLLSVEIKVACNRLFWWLVCSVAVGELQHWWRRDVIKTCWQAKWTGLGVGQVCIVRMFALVHFVRFICWTRGVFSNHTTFTELSTFRCKHETRYTDVYVCCVTNFVLHLYSNTIQYRHIHCFPCILQNYAKITHVCGLETT